MKSTYLTSKVSKIGRWVATAVFCLSAIAFVWQGGFLTDNAAMAVNNNPTLIASGMAGEAKEKASEDAQNTKGFIDNVKNQVKRTAKNNADRVENATDGSGNFLERKANRDAATIQKRANEDAARTKSAVDATKNAAKDAINNIKDTFD